MTVFWIVAGALVLASLLFVIPPLFQRRNQEEVGRAETNISIYKAQLAELEADLAAGDVIQESYDKNRNEIERRLLEDTAVAEEGAKKTSNGLTVATAAVAVIAVPLAAFILYDELGNPDGMNPQAVLAAQPENSPHGESDADVAAQIEMMVARLSQRLLDDPSDIEGWVMLGRSMTVLGRYQEAVMAYERALQFTGEDPNVLTDYADAIAMATGESLAGKPMELLQRALVIDPNNQKALWLGGTGLFESGDFAGAIRYWSHLKDLLPEGSEDIEVMRANIAEAQTYRKRQLAGEFDEAPAVSAELPETNVAALSRITGRVSLSADLLDKVGADDVLFIFARAVNGPPMPLAIIRETAAELPLEFSLDETMAMMPSMSLAKFDEVVVGARISKTGNAMPQSGDLEGVTGAISVGTEGLEILIDTLIQ